MLNVAYKITDMNQLQIVVDLEETYGKSKSGKTIVVASTKGNKRIEGTDCFLGLNVYKYPEGE